MHFRHFRCFLPQTWRWISVSARHVSTAPPDLAAALAGVDYLFRGGGDQERLLPWCGPFAPRKNEVGQNLPGVIYDSLDVTYIVMCSRPAKVKMVKNSSCAP